MDGDSQQSLPAKTQVTLTGIQETLLITLYGKWYDFNSPHPILGDKWAAQILERIDGNEALAQRLKGQPANVSGVAVRARLLDRWTAEFLDGHEHATVLHLACGLDTRALRLQEKCGPGIRWIDLDVPEVIELRRKLIPEPALPGGYEMVASSVTEKEWLLNIPSDRPVVAVFEGLTMYLEAEEGKDLLRRLTAHFPSGQLLFDVLSSFAMSFLNSFLRIRGGWDVVFRWGVDYPRELEKLHKGLKLRDLVVMTQAPGVDEFPTNRRITMYIMSWIPYLRSLFMYLRFEF